MSDNDKTPNPGTDEAIDAGCTCPVMDNEFGRGYHGEAGVFCCTVGCPVHKTINAGEESGPSHGSPARPDAATSDAPSPALSDNDKLTVTRAELERIALAYEQTAEGMQREYEADPLDKCAGQQAESDRLIARVFRSYLDAVALLRECRANLSTEHHGDGWEENENAANNTLARLDAFLATTPLSDCGEG